jgi:hypothetical protein
MKMLLVLPESAPRDPEPLDHALALASAGRRGGLAIEVVEPDPPAFDASMARSRPDAVVVVGTTRAAREVLAKARSKGVAAVVALSDLKARDPLAFEAADAVLVPSRFAADYYAEALGLRCSVAPTWVDPDRAIAEGREPKYATFVDPSAGNGAYVYARIAEELARRRPDIPLLIVGARGSGATLAGSGVDVLSLGNVSLMERTQAPRDHWRVTRLALFPSLDWDAVPRKLAEALANGIPAVVSDRGALPEVHVDRGASLPIPDRITPATRSLPTPDEVAPWVDTILRLWDESPVLLPSPGGRGEQEDARALLAFFQSLRPRSTARLASPPRRARSIVLVPFFSSIERPCEQSLRKLEEAGVKVVRSEGCPQIDVARNMLASDALNQGFESIFFIDADLGFDPLDALRLLARPDPVISGVYAKKRQKGFASIFADGIPEVVFGAKSPGPYPLKYAAGGFLRIKADVLRRMVDELKLPACNAGWDRRDYPFFMPMAVPTPDGSHHYLGEDWAFSHRLRQVGITPLADTSIRLWHCGSYAYGWEDAGGQLARHDSIIIQVEAPKRPA